MKRTLPQAIILLAAILNLTACLPLIPHTTSTFEYSVAEPTASSSVVNTEASPLPAFTATCETTPLPENIQLSEKTTYQFSISLNYQKHHLSVSEIIDYTNNTGEPIADLPLIVPPAHIEGAFQLISFQMESNHKNSTIRLEQGVLYISLEPALKPNENLEISLLFHLALPRQKSTFGYTDRQLLLADWYPFIPPNLDNQGWLISPPGAVGEYLSYPLNHFSVNLMLTPPNESLVVAASAPLQSHEGNCYRYTVENVRNFSLAISPEYQITRLESGLTSFSAYTFPEHADMGHRAAALALKAWETFTNLYGDNQRNILSIVEADIHDGLECDGLFYLSDWYFSSADETPKNYFETLIVHETSHQWFYGLVHNDQAHQPWLDEALATYNELIYLESHHPELTNWWWDFRVNAYSPTGYVNSTIYDYNEYRPYINAVYLNGVKFLHELRQVMDQDAFMTFLYAYAQSGQDHHDSSFFFSLLVDFDGFDISPIVAKYFK